MKVYNLVPPESDISKYIGYNIGIRPARKGGPRIERENIRDKIVYHNYGHAGYGVTMAYGSAKLSVSMCANDLGHSHKQIAVIGCGYMGLHSALLLKNLGYDVTIYADVFPAKFGVFNDSKSKLTSQIAAGQILPSHFDYSPNKPLTQLICQTTFEYLERMYEQKKYKGILKRDVFFIHPPKDLLTSFVEGTMTPIEEVKISFNTKHLIPGYRTTTYQFEGDIPLNKLMEEAKSIGVQIVNHRFENLDEILSLKEKVIFNCSGFSSKYLFNDDKMVPLKGVMLAMKLPKGYDYFLETFINNKSYSFTTYPMHERISYGLIKVEEEELGYENEQKYFKILSLRFFRKSNPTLKVKQSFHLFEQKSKCVSKLPMNLQSSYARLVREEHVDLMPVESLAHLEVVVGQLENGL